MEIIKKIPIHPLSAGELLKYANLLKIPNFRGVFMRDTLPNRIWYSETGVVNLDSIFGSGTHWVCYSKNGKNICYFDSYGNLGPPLELVEYFNTSSQQPLNIVYNYECRQNMNTVICGHLCLMFLCNVLFKW